MSRTYYPGIEAAVKHLLEELKTKAYKASAIPADPDRSKFIEKEIK